MSRTRAHQLVFETTGVALLLVATREPALVLIPAAVLLPGWRATWWEAVRPRRRTAVPSDDYGFSEPTTHMAKNWEPPP